MALLDYTTPDHIRAVLGISAKELKDSTLALDLWETQFLLEMGDVDGGAGAVITQYETIAGIPSASRNSNQKSFYAMVRMMAAYSVARQLLSPQVMFAVQRVTDGKAEFERFNQANFDKVRVGVEGLYSSLLKRITALLAVLAPGTAIPAATVVIGIVSAPLAFDPVTGV